MNSLGAAMKLRSVGGGSKLGSGSKQGLGEAGAGEQLGCGFYR